MKINLDSIPSKPGIYIWKDEYGNFLYVGKAKNLKNRMKQYFKGMLNSYKTSKLVEKIKDFEIIITKNEKEALILERNFIEKYSPEFNILLTDDKRYPYIKLELKDKVYISLVYRVRSIRDNAKYFGPYPAGTGIRKYVNLLNRLTTFDKGLPIRDNNEVLWREKYNYAKSILTSNGKQLINELKKQMINASENMQYEIAQDLKETIESIEINQDKQSVEFATNENIDVIGFYNHENYISISMLFYRAGVMISQKEFVIEKTSDEESIRQFVSQYYSRNIKPNKVLSNIEFETDLNLIVPIKGKNKSIVNLALENAKNNIDVKLNTFIRKEEQRQNAFDELKKIIGLDNISHIMMIDNSNLNNTNIASVLVSYRNGVKQKGEYRKYTLEPQDRLADVDYMKQGLTKYFSKPENKIPNLLIVDGGKAQINEAKKVCPKDLNIIGLVKDDNHRTESLIDLNGVKHKLNYQPLHNLLAEMQIEVDRFAKYHHSNLRKKSSLEGKLNEIKGIGKATEERLLNHFKTYSAIYNASLEELQKVVSENIAKLIKKHLN